MYIRKGGKNMKGKIKTKTDKGYGFISREGEEKDTGKKPVRKSKKRGSKNKTVRKTEDNI